MNNILTLQYADDFVFYVQNNNIPNSVADIQNCIMAVTSLLEQIGLEISLTKTQLCLLVEDGEKIGWMWLLMVIPWLVVDCIRYLGVWMDGSLRWGTHIKEVHEKSMKLMILKILAGVS